MPGATLFLARERSPMQASSDGIGRDAEPFRRARDRQDGPVACLSIPVGRPVGHDPGIIAPHDVERNNTAPRVMPRVLR